MPDSARDSSARTPTLRAPPSHLGTISVRAAELVETVNVEVSALAPGVTALGEKLHEPPVGNPEHASETLSPKEPPSGATVTVYVAD